MIFWCFTFCAIQWNGDFFAILCNRMNREFRYVIFCHLLQFNEPAMVFRYFTYDLLRFCGMQWINDIALPCQMLAELAWWQNWRLVCCQKRSAAVLKKVRSSWSLLDLGKKAPLCSGLVGGKALMGDYHSSCSLYVSTNNLLSMLKWRLPRKGWRVLWS